ncbi:hypothetical protein LINPERHAP1_LOCUS15825 [Linum perenne]
MNLLHNRLGEEYNRGVVEFLDYAFQRNGGGNEVRCPCVKCLNARLETRDTILVHLKLYGILANYTFWCHHGERLDEDFESRSPTNTPNNFSSIHQLISDLRPSIGSSVEIGAGLDYDDGFTDEPNEDARKFYRLLDESEKPIYNGCKSSMLSIMVKLLHIKTIGNWSNESFTMLLKMLKEDLLPDGSSLPESYYESKKTIRDLGLSYKKIDACTNSCMLFWKDDIHLDKCRVCKESRWKVHEKSKDVIYKVNGKRLPLKTLRYFPLKPRLQRLFMSTKVASLMTWHHEKRSDGVMRHPVDSEAWISFDNLHKSFSSDPRNVRLALASDGFQPFSNSKKPHSIWPVVLIPYNLPPWMIMKSSNFIISMLIPGPESLGDAIDVYLQPLIAELKELWEVGIQTFDASKRQNFQLHAALMWTINDFPAYGNLSGWSTKGRLACPACNMDTMSTWLYKGAKFYYMGHRRWLPTGHRWRRDKESFDGTKEKRIQPRSFSGDDLLSQMQDLEGIPLTKCTKTKVKIDHKFRGDNWNKKSIFFCLPYWKSNLLRHNLDVMHIEKNVCDNVLGTIMNLAGKTKDTLKTRLDLEAMGIRKDLHPIREGNKVSIPHATYTLSQDMKREFCQFLKKLKVPDGFSSNISQCVNVNERKISGMKSHDCHVLLQHVIPLAIRGLLPKEVCEPIIELSIYFRSLCSKSLHLDQLEQLKKQIPLTLCKLEKIFPPAFFDVMVHLPIHLADEAMLGGPVQYRWMYPIERYLYQLKSFVRNRTHPEGSIAEGYIAFECMTLCSRYLSDISTRFNKPDRNFDGGDMTEFLSFSQVGRTLGVGALRIFSMKEVEQAHIYVMKNSEEVQPYIE